METVNGETKASLYVQDSEINYYTEASPLGKRVLVSSIAAGVQFGWALQLSLLTPYVQLLGVPHTWAAFIWLCGPISGMLVQPIVGYYSDRCTAKLGRRRPFIISGAILVIFAVIMIGFAADFGHSLGDSLTETPKGRAVTFFVIGFWILDVANNMLQGPCRALLADLSGHSPGKTRAANAFFSFFMAIGNVLGYAAGSYPKLYKVFPFTKTEACDIYCANLKSCFIISVCLLLFLTTIALTSITEKQHVRSDKGDDEETQIPFFGELFTALKGLSRPMWILMLVTALNWIAWFGFLLFDTDWMGKEVYGGKVGSGRLYDMGVRAGSLGLLVNSVVLGLMSLAIEFLSRVIGGTNRLWGIVNFVLAGCLAMTVVITKMAEHFRSTAPPDTPPPIEIKAAAISLFGALGIPQAVTFSIPFALASIFSNESGAGQGLSLGVLNLAIVIPQMLVSVVSGPLDAMFGGGNLPAFVLGAVAAAISGVLALVLLPRPPQHAPRH